MRLTETLLVLFCLNCSRKHTHIHTFQSTNNALLIVIPHICPFKVKNPHVHIPLAAHVGSFTCLCTGVSAWIWDVYGTSQVCQFGFRTVLGSDLRVSPPRESSQSLIFFCISKQNCLPNNINTNSGRLCFLLLFHTMVQSSFEPHLAIYLPSTTLQLKLWSTTLIRLLPTFIPQYLRQPPLFPDSLKSVQVLII